MGKDEKGLIDILPSEGIWTIEGLANFLRTDADMVIQKLSDMNVPIISFSRRYRHKLFRLEDLKSRTTS